jgi:hypothetical protein
MAWSVLVPDRSSFCPPGHATACGGKARHDASFFRWARKHSNGRSEKIDRFLPWSSGISGLCAILAYGIL